MDLRSSSSIISSPGDLRPSGRDRGEKYPFEANKMGTVSLERRILALCAVAIRCVVLSIDGRSEHSELAVLLILNLLNTRSTSSSSAVVS